MSKTDKLQLLLFHADPRCHYLDLPIAEDPICVQLNDGDLFLGRYDEDECNYYGYYVKCGDGVTFLKTTKPFMLSAYNVTELEDFKSEKEDKSKEDNPDDEEPKLKVTCSAVPWYIASFHWIKSALGFHAAKLYKDEFLNGIEDYQYQAE